MSGPATRLYKSGDGNVHTGRRADDEVKLNEREYNQILKLEAQLDALLQETNDLRVEIKETRGDMRKYNGLHEDRNKLQDDSIRQWKELARLSRQLIELEGRPCRESNLFEKLHDSIDKTNEALNDLSLGLSTMKTEKETQEKTSNSIKGNIGQYLGWIVAVVSLFSLVYDKFM